MNIFKLGKCATAPFRDQAYTIKWVMFCAGVKHARSHAHTNRSINIVNASSGFVFSIKKKRAINVEGGTETNFGYDAYSLRQVWTSAGCFDVQLLPAGTFAQKNFICFRFCYLNCIFLSTVMCQCCSGNQPPLNI